MSTVDDIPADKVLTLTKERDRMFRAAGCRPTCHACWRAIPVGKKFQLLTFQGKDTMICSACNETDLVRAYPWKPREPNSGFSRPTRHREPRR